MSKNIDMDYPLRKPEQEEIISAFGSLRHARNVLGRSLDDMGAVCFFINNPERIPPDTEVEKVLEAWSSAPKKKSSGKPSIKEVSRMTGFCWSKAKQLLIEGGGTGMKSAATALLFAACFAAALGLEALIIEPTHQEAHP